MPYKVSIHEEPWNSAINITIWDERNGHIWVAMPLDLRFMEATDGLAVGGPTLRLNQFAGPEVLKAFAEALDEHGVKTDSDAKLSGTVTAQTKHLEDLRHLLKLPKNAEGK